jgi:hypothetical protein
MGNKFTGPKSFNGDLLFGYDQMHKTHQPRTIYDSNAGTMDLYWDANGNLDCSRLYFRGLSAVTRSTSPSQDELAKRARFSAVAAAVAARAKDLTKITADQAAFKAQKDEPGGKQTMRSYLWSLELASYDQNHG